MKDEKVRLLIEIVKSNPTVDIEKLMELAGEDEDIKISEDVEINDIPDEPRRKRMKFGARSYTTSEHLQVKQMLDEFGGIPANVPKNRVRGLAESLNRSENGIMSRLYAIQSGRA